MATIKISKDVGPISAAIFFIILGLYFLGVLTGTGIMTILGILALITGVLQLIELS